MPCLDIPATTHVQDGRQVMQQEHDIVGCGGGEGGLGGVSSVVEHPEGVLEHVGGGEGDEGLGVVVPRGGTVGEAGGGLCVGSSNVSMLLIFTVKYCVATLLTFMVGCVISSPRSGPSNRLECVSATRPPRHSLSLSTVAVCQPFGMRTKCSQRKRVIVRQVPKNIIDGKTGGGSSFGPGLPNTAL